MRTTTRTDLSGRTPGVVRFKNVRHGSEAGLVECWAGYRNACVLGIVGDEMDPDPSSVGGNPLGRSRGGFRRTDRPSPIQINAEPRASGLTSGGGKGPFLK